MSVPYYGDFAEDDTVNIPFNTFTSDDPSASSTITNLVAGDIKIHKDGAVAEKASSDGVTVTVNFDGITGNHLVSLDTSNDTGAAGFWVTGSEYQVRMEGTTIDGATVNAWIGTFSIERAGGTIALLKLIQAAVITNAAGADIAADIIAVKAETAAIVNDTDLIDDGTSGLAKIATDVAAILVDTGTTLQGELDGIQADTEDIQAQIGTAGAGLTDLGGMSSGMKTEITQQTGYQLGAVWFDTGGAAGATSYVNGIITNPCSSPVNTHTLLTNLNLKVVRVVNASNYVVEATYTGFSFIGEKWTLSPSGQQMINCYFEGATITSGTFHANSTGCHFKHCVLDTVTLPAGNTATSQTTMRDCGGGRRAGSRWQRAYYDRRQLYGGDGVYSWKL
jgi:hypothetical protein